MLTTTTTELIHRVLDGEASEAQAQQLQQLLAAEPAARAEFEAVQQLFIDFKSVPQKHPPEGLVAAVMAAVAVPAAKSRRSNQLFSWPRVFGPAPRDSVSRTSATPHRNTRLQSFFRSIDMSQQTRSPFGSRKIWIGGAIAAAAVVVVAQFGLGGKTNEKDLIGTIAPADRYRAPQATGADVKAGTTTGGDTKPTEPGAAGQGGGGAAQGGATAAQGGATAAQGGATAAQGGATAAQGGAAAAQGGAAAAQGGATAAQGGAAAAQGGATAAQGGAAAAQGGATAAQGGATAAQGGAGK